MGPRRFGPFGLLIPALALLALSAPRAAIAQAEAADRVRWLAPERSGCPAEAVVRRELSALLSKGRAEARASARIEARVRPAKEGGFVLELTVEDRLGPRTRELSTKSCALAARAAALIAALVLEQGDAAPAPLTTTATVTSLPAAQSSTASAALTAKIRRALVAAEVLEPEEPAAAEPVAFYARALVAVDGGRAPSAALVLSVGLGLRFGRLGLGALASFSPWTRGFFPGRLDAGADLRSIVGALEGAWAFTMADPILTLGARLEAGALSGRGFGLEASVGTLDRLWLAVGLGPALRAEILSPISLLLRLELLIPLARPSFEAKSGETLFQPPPVSVAASIGLELFP